MTQNISSWSVVATVDEPPALVQAFVAWYLWLGAAEVVLYFDRADDPAIEVVAHLPQVTVVQCDAVHWARLGKRRPDKHQIRQVRNATHAYSKTTSTWLLHCDADEFLWSSRPVGACLSDVYPWIDCAVTPVAERVFWGDAHCDTVFSGAFRLPFAGSPAAGRDVFGPGYDLTLRGLTGHAIGKGFARTGRGLEVSVHRAKAKTDDVQTELVSDVVLLHFDGLTRLHWVYKLLRKADALANHGGMVPSPHRQRQIDVVLGDQAAAFALHDQLKCVGAGSADLLADVAFDPAEAIAAIFGTALDQSAAAFDAWLRDQKGAVFDVFE